MDDLVAKILQLHERLEQQGIPHAFGGALALAWCTQRARGTIDIDLNLLIPASDWRIALEALPVDVKVTQKDRALLKRDSQARVWWDKTPLDLFLNVTAFHEDIAGRVRWETFAGQSLPFLSCFDLAVFKAFFNRTKDWADLEAMAQAGTLDKERVMATLIRFLGTDDERLQKLTVLE